MILSLCRRHRYYIVRAPSNKRRKSIIISTAVGKVSSRGQTCGAHDVRCTHNSMYSSWQSSVVFNFHNGERCSNGEFFFRGPRRHIAEKTTTRKEKIYVYASLGRLQLYILLLYLCRALGP